MPAGIKCGVAAVPREGWPSLFVPSGWLTEGLDFINHEFRDLPVGQGRGPFARWKLPSARPRAWKAV